jgi:hypothetical protein
MFLPNLLSSMLQYATRRMAAPHVNPVLPANVRVLPVMGRARVPLANMPRVGEIDGDTMWMPRPGDPGVNGGPGYRPGRHRAPDYNEMPARFARQRVA